MTLTRILTTLDIESGPIKGKKRIPHRLVACNMSLTGLTLEVSSVGKTARRLMTLSRLCSVVSSGVGRRFTDLYSEMA
jgi:hypothetical protein